MPHLVLVVFAVSSETHDIYDAPERRLMDALDRHMPTNTPITTSNRFGQTLRLDSWWIPDITRGRGTHGLTY